MIKIVVVDDENNVREVLKKIIGYFGNSYAVVGEANSIRTAKQVITATQPDIVLLDIELKDGTAFSLLKQLPVVNFKLIFITAYNQYAIKAFKFSALDYLLKPIDPKELEIALNKAKNSIETTEVLQKRLLVLEDKKTPKIVIKTTNNTHFITIEDIIYCQAEGAYTKIITHNKTILASKNLKYFEDLLSDKNFIRTHQSYLVNASTILHIKNNTMILNNQIEIPVSVRKKSKIIAYLKG